MAHPPLRVGVIGCGYWGPNLIRNFFGLNESTVTMVADRVPAALSRVRKIYPAIECTAEADALIASPNVDAVAIATPVATHFPLAKAALEAGKHVFVEKPIAERIDQAEELIELARNRQRVLMVDHTFLYTGAVRRMRQSVENGELGELLYFDSARINLGLLQPDVNVVWDLATHDISILQFLVDESPESVQAVGYRHIGGRNAELAMLNLNYKSGFHAHIRVSWLSPVKVRETMLAGRKKMIVFDDLEPTDKIRIYDKGVELSIAPGDVTAEKPIYRAGDVLIPEFDRSEALQREARHFVDCVQNGRRPQSGGEEGLAVLRVLDAADRSLAADCAFVPL